MPVILVNRNDFWRLLGKPMSMEDIEERLPMLGVGWEGKEGDEFQVEVFPNRPDMLSVEGLARAFSSFMNIQKGLREYKAEQEEYYVKVDESVETVRPYFVSCVVKDVEFTDDFIRSIMQMQEKLHITHCRKRKKAAIGLHDLDKIHFPVIYTAMQQDFRFIPLDEKREFSLKEILEYLPKGKEYAWILEGKRECPILVDAKDRVLSMPPIINSEHTKITSKTRNVFIDITATDEKTANEVLNIIATTFADRGGKIYRVKIKYPDTVLFTPNLNPKVMNLDLHYVNTTLGLKLTNFEIIEYLQRMGHDATEVGNNIEVIIPCYRTDVMHAFDLVEDIAIAYGYENFEAVIPNISTIGEEDESEVFATRLRSLMIGYNLQEVITFMLTNKENLFKKMNLEEMPIAETSNSKTQEYSVVRNWLIPSLMEVLARNKHNEYPQNLFEVGDVVMLDETSETGSRAVKKLAAVLCHSRANFSEMKSLIESFLKNLGIENYEIAEVEHPSFIFGRVTKISIGFIELGIFGEIHPTVLENWKLEAPVAACEFNVDLLFELSGKTT